MIPIDPKLLENLYGKDLIVFGTGRTGKIVTLYLEQVPNIHLLGVTNSRVSEYDGGTFLDTNLPIRSIQAWAELAPKAAILITATSRQSQMEIGDFCKKVGFQETIPLTANLMNAIAYAQVNAYALPREAFLDQCERGGAFTGNPLLNLMCFANELCDTHKISFSEFRACNRGRDVVVVGTGPSMNYYSQIQGLPHIGVNAAVKRQDIKLDYYFFFDYKLRPEYCVDLKKHDCIKFFGIWSCEDASNRLQIPESIIEENHGRKFFFTEDRPIIHIDIEHHPLMGYNSIIFPAINFAIYTRPKRIFLVGCDCSNAGHFDGFPSIGGASTLTDGYQHVKDFVERYYPDTEIVSVNPVGLKGMFHGVYTESYLDAHPEIDRETCEVLKPEDYEE